MKLTTKPKFSVLVIRFSKREAIIPFVKRLTDGGTEISLGVANFRFIGRRGSYILLKISKMSNRKLVTNVFRVNLISR